MTIDWSALGQVFGVTMVLTVGLVGVFTLGIVATARRTQPETSGVPTAAATVTDAGRATGALVRSAGYLCFTVCAVAVVYGISLIVV